MAVMVTSADAYFGTRLNSRAWDNACAGDKLKALLTADRHIANLGLKNDTPSQNREYAVYEQAIFLLEMSDYDYARRRNQAAGIVEESIGKASQKSTEALIKQAQAGAVISPLAMDYIRDYIQGRRATSSVKIGGLR